MVTRNCIICNTALKPEVYEGIEIDVCVRGHGLWLDSGELSKIITIREKKFDSQLMREVSARQTSLGVSGDEFKRNLNCIECDEIMPPVNYQYSSGIVINKCPNDHGLWLDQGELDKIQVYMEHWEDTVLQNKEKYSELISHVKESQNARRAAHLNNLNSSNFEFINAIIRRIIDKIN